MKTIADETPGTEGTPTSEPGPVPVLPAGPVLPGGPVLAGGPATGPDPAWRAPEGSDAEIAARMRLAILRLSRRLRQQVAGGVTSSQVSALATIERLGNPTLGELAASEQVQPPSMTKTVVGLEGAGLVARQEDDNDRRIVRVKLSGEGRRTLARSRSLRTAYLVRRLRALSSEDRAALGDAVRLLEHLVDQS